MKSGGPPTTGVEGCYPRPQTQNASRQDAEANEDADAVNIEDDAQDESDAEAHAASDADGTNNGCKADLKAVKVI